MAVSSPGSTPILDRLDPLPPLRTSRRTPLKMFASIGGGLCFGLWLSLTNARSRPGGVGSGFARAFEQLGQPSMLELAVAALIALFVAIAIHEAGHALIGWLVGFRIHSIRIWRLELHAPFRLSVYRGSGRGASGWVASTPGTTDNLAARAAAMLLAGPAANLLSAAVLYWAIDSHDLAMQCLAMWSLVLGSINLLPIRTGPFFSDGHRLLMLLVDSLRGERWLAMLKLTKDLIDGLPPEHLSDEFLAVATAVKDDSSDTVSAHLLAYSAAFGRGHDADAARLLETSLQYSGYTSPGFQHALMADAAVFQGRRRHRADLAEQWLCSMPVKTEVPWHRAWAEAGVLEARGDFDAVRAKLDAIEQAILAQPTPLQACSLGSVERWRAELARRPVVTSSGRR